MSSLMPLQIHRVQMPLTSLTCYSHLTWMQIYSRRLQSEESQTDHWLVDVISTKSSVQVNMWPRERDGVSLLLWLFYFIQMTMTILSKNMNSGCVLKDNFNTLFCLCISLYKVEWQPPSRHSGSVPIQDSGFNLPCALALFLNLHTVMRKTDATWIPWIVMNSQLIMHLTGDTYYLMSGMWIRALDEKGSAFWNETSLVFAKDDWEQT